MKFFASYHSNPFAFSDVHELFVPFYFDQDHAFYRQFECFKERIFFLLLLKKTISSSLTLYFSKASRELLCVHDSTKEAEELECEKDPKMKARERN